MKLGFLTTHPIQYQVPWFRRLADVPGIDLRVFFALIPDADQQGEGFGVPFQWDVPLTNGYHYEVLDNVARTPSVGTFSGCDTPGISRVVRDGGFDAFIVNGWVAKCCLQVLAACNRHGVPCIVRGESNLLTRRVWWKRALHRLLLGRYAAFLTIGVGNRQFYLANGVASSKLFPAPYCVDNDRFERGAEQLRPDRQALRQHWGINPSSTTFLYCAKFIPKKHPLTALRALAEVCRRRPDLPIHLLMVGTGQLHAECQAYARTHHLPVTFSGFLNQGEIARAYVAADSLVLPSDEGETWGLVVNEAMACGLPALVSDRVGCHLDLLTPGVTGDVFPCDDVGALAHAMTAMAAEPQALRRMGQHARQLVARYSYEAVVDGTLAALEFVRPGARTEGGVA